MGVITCNYEFKTSVPVSKMFKAFVVDSHHLLPKLMPQAFKSIEVEEGDGGVGTVYKTNFADGLPYKYLKQKVDVLDSANYVYNYTTYGGDALGDKYEKVVSEGKYEADGEGCVIKVQNHYHTKGDISEDEVKADHAQQTGVFKIVEQYLLANPDYA